MKGRASFALGGAVDLTSDAAPLFDAARAFAFTEVMARAPARALAEPTGRMRLEEHAGAFTLSLSIDVDDVADVAPALAAARACGAARIALALDPALLIGDESLAALDAALAEAAPTPGLLIAGSLATAKGLAALAPRFAGRFSGALIAMDQDVEAAQAAWPAGEIVVQTDATATPSRLAELAERAASICLPLDAPASLLRVAALGGGPAADFARLFARPAAGDAAIVVIGGAGFIGCNLADALARDGAQVRVIDNLSRPGVEANLAWLRERHPALDARYIDIARGDQRDGELDAALDGAEAVFHFAAQVAVTTSLEAPVADFEINARGTLNVLEALRRRAPKAPLIFSSTNKVYGCLESLAVDMRGDRYAPVDAQVARWGVSEDRPLDLRTPYGCSKGAADQYVLDYAKSFGMRAAVLRMSCIYGPRQFGTEDQGWVAHFLLRALRGEPITIFGDGRQVRDILHVKDAVDAYLRVLRDIDRVSGRAFNLGGGPDNAVSLRQVLAAIGDTTGLRPRVAYDDWRAGDQPYFVADTRALGQTLGWRATVDWRAGLKDLARWLTESGLAPRADAAALSA
ncbi:MAG TPA: NAD-dependent epimerase/dehydratase family protein [Beijerinckiaceae bacterium]